MGIEPLPSTSDRITAFINQIVSSVTGAIRRGSEADRHRLASSLREMEQGMAAVPEDTADARSFIAALISILEGRPVSADSLVEPYASIYVKVITDVLTPDSDRVQGGPDDAMRNFLTQLSATVVMVMRKGAEDEKKALAVKLRDIKDGMAGGTKDAADFVLALAGLLDGRPVDADTLSAAYGKFYNRVAGSIASGSR